MMEEYEFVVDSFCIFGLLKLIFMVAVVGTYQNGFVELDREYPSDKPVRVILTFLEEVKSSSDKVLSLSDFSFAKSRQILSNYKGSLSDAVIEERRTDYETIS